MPVINLNEYYPWYKAKENMFVPDDVAEALLASKLQERAYIRRLIRNKAQFSLNCNDGIEFLACYSVPDPHTVLEKNEKQHLLQEALLSLPVLRRRRIIMRYYLQMTLAEIAEVESVSPAAVHSAIQRGLFFIRIFLNKNGYSG